MLDEMKELLKEIATQDNRGTAMPYYYVIMEKEQVPCAEVYDPDGYWYKDSDADFDCNNIEELIDHIKDYYADEISWKEEYGIDIDTLNEHDIDCYGLLDELDIDKIPFRTVDKVSEFAPIFFTEIEAKQYIKNQAHNLSEGAYEYMKYTGGSMDITFIFKYLKWSVERIEELEDRLAHAHNWLGILNGEITKDKIKYDYNKFWK